MCLALSDNATRLEAMSSLEINFPAGLVDVEPQIVEPESEEEILRQSRQEVSALVVF